MRWSSESPPIILSDAYSGPGTDTVRLLKLYAKLLPDKGAEEEEAERKDTDTPHRPDTLP